MKKTVVFIAAVIVLAGCISRKDRLSKEKICHHNYMELQGHEYWTPTVGSVSGQSSGSIFQLVHLPECQKCREQQDSLVRTAIHDELINLGLEER